MAKSSKSKTSFFTSFILDNVGAITENKDKITEIQKETSFILDKINLGIIGIKHVDDKKDKMILIIKKGQCTYTYNIENKEDVQFFPLQMGTGTYNICIKRNTRDNLYVLVKNIEIEVYLKSLKSPYLQSIQNIYWQDNSLSSQLAKKITFKINDDQLKIREIYNYFIANMNYDEKKYPLLDSTYVPDVTQILKLKKGICYDFSSAYAAMMRSLGIPTKLVMGYADNISGYHAWNEVFDGQKWQVVDITKDIAYLKHNEKVEMFKDNNNYFKIKEY